MSNHSFAIRIGPPGSMSDRISVIKSIRMLTGLGLKEAKDASERQGEQHFEINMGNFTSYGHPDSEIENQFRILRNGGIEVGDSVHHILQSLRDLGADALKQGEDELASEILQLVLAEKLRRKP